MSTFVELESKLHDKINPMTTQAHYDAWEQDFYTSRETWSTEKVDINRQSDLFIAFLELKHAPKVAIIAPTDIDLAIQASLENQKERREGKIPPNKTQVGRLSKTLEHKSSGVKSLQPNYPGLRTVRGDGNCYYRSVMYGLIEQIVLSSHRTALFDQLSLKLKTLRGAYAGQYDRDVNALIEMLHQARDGQKWGSVNALEKDMRSPDSTTDRLLVLSARLLTALATEKIDPCFRLHNDIASILTMGHDASGAPIQTGALLNALGISGNIEIVNADNIKIGGVKSGVAEHPLMPKLAVHVLLKGGHYDLLYSNEHYSKINAHTKHMASKKKHTPSKVPSVCTKESLPCVSDKQSIEHTMALLEQFTQDIINNPLAKGKSKKAFLYAVHQLSRVEQVNILWLATQYLNDNLARLKASKRVSPKILAELEKQAQSLQKTVNQIHPSEDNKVNRQEDHPLPPKGLLMTLISNILSMLEQLFNNLSVLFLSAPSGTEPKPSAEENQRSKNTSSLR